MSLPELRANPSMLIGENYWQRRFGGDPDVLGKTIYLNGVPITVVAESRRTILWGPISARPIPGFPSPSSRSFMPNPSCCRIGKPPLPPVRSSRARRQHGSGTGRDEFNRRSPQNARQDPHSETAKPATVIVWRGSPFPLPISRYGGLQLAIALIMAAAGMVLVVACANVGSFPQRSALAPAKTNCAPAVSRRRTPARIIRQLLTDSSLLGLLAGILALPLELGVLESAGDPGRQRPSPLRRARSYSISRPTFPSSSTCSPSRLWPACCPGSLRRWKAPVPPYRPPAGRALLPLPRAGSRASSSRRR